MGAAEKQQSTPLRPVDCGMREWFIKRYREASPAQREVVDMLLQVDDEPPPWVDEFVKISVSKLKEKVLQGRERHKRAMRLKLNVCHAK